MNKPRKLKARIIDCLMNPMASLGFALLGLGFAIVSAVLVALCPDYEGLSARLMAMAGGFLAVAVLLQTMKRADTAEKAVVQTEKAVGQTEKALDQTKKSIVQKTFRDATDHLGHERESVILLGIYSLLDFAKENSDYRPRVFNILCAYIQTTTTAEEYQKKHPKQPSTIIQKLLGLLFQGEEYSIVTVDPVKTSRTADEEYSFEKMFRFDLRGAYLAGSNLLRARLQGGDLSGAQLQHAFLPEAQLQGAFLVGTELQEASLMLAQLQGAHLAKAHLQKAELRQTEMQGACMYQTELPHETQMGGSDLRGVSSLKPDHFIGFKKRIKNQIGEETDLSGVVFDEVNPDLATPQNEGTAKTGSYTKEESDQWIKEYDGAFRWKKHKD